MAELNGYMMKGGTNVTRPYSRTDSTKNKSGEGATLRCIKRRRGFMVFRMKSHIGVDAGTVMSIARGDQQTTRRECRILVNPGRR